MLVFLCVIISSCQDGGPAASPHFPHKAFWVSLSASLLLVIIALGLTGHLGLPQLHSQVQDAPRPLPPLSFYTNMKSIKSVPVAVAFKDCPNHSPRSDWSSDQPVDCCGPAERPGDLFRDLTSQSHVHCAL